ncbi:scavenger receptor cysteine-rich domain-containing protein DMBT1-like [Amphiura filiformis]|uniref:scavenger receptor cysteine-rich domain-containing protein DMBT1-like n=1 Tax=Amphiura filiformis TaxID=82378 RepID=UPI003B215565
MRKLTIAFIVLWGIIVKVAVIQGSAASIRLVGGNISSEGRVEFFYNNTWGTVCHHSWSRDDAYVVCRQLQLPLEDAQVTRDALFGEGAGQIWLNNVDCSGSENSLDECIHDGWGISTGCTHEMDAGVICTDEFSTEVRLVGGNSSNLGRIEVLFHNVWRGVCPNRGKNREAVVVCRQLGLPYSAAQNAAIFGRGPGHTWLSNIGCSGSESRLEDCGHSGWGYYTSCGRGDWQLDDAGVICTDDRSAASIRLVGSNSSSEGRVEIFYNNTWGTVCHQSWGNNDAHVVCRQLQLPFQDAQGTRNAVFGKGAGQIWLKSVDCSGSENSLDECNHDGWGISTGCTHEDDAGVICTDEFSTDVRLVGGNSSNLGRIEVFFHNVWGRICPDFWDNTETVVVCRQLGLPYGAAKNAAFFGRGSGHPWLRNVQCSGSESRLENCGHRGWGYKSCGWNLGDAGVICTDDPISLQIRLIGGNSHTGRVEVLLGNSWGTICDDQWDQYDATVVCRQLWLPFSNPTATRGASFGEGSEYIWLDDVRCTGFENNLGDCIHSGLGYHDCDHTQDAGVICAHGSAASIRLVGRNSSSEGRVEMFYNNTWGTVCHQSWGNNDAHVVCRQLQLPFQDAQGTRNALFGEGTGQIWLKSVDCSGSENSLDECSHDGWGISPGCMHEQDAGVICTDEFSTEIRLVGGNSSNLGRIEVLFHGVWGGVCPDYWDNQEAAVVCRQLGLPYGVAKKAFFFGRGSGHPWLRNVQCSGSESRLENCGHLGWGYKSCGWKLLDDAGVICTDDHISLQIRLIGENSHMGRVEVLLGNSWGTICDNQWDQYDATVVCRQLGLPFSNPTATRGASFGEGSEYIWLDDVGCTGLENNLGDCIHSGLGYHSYSCDHAQDAGVICANETSAQLVTVSIAQINPYQSDQDKSYDEQIQELEEFGKDILKGIAEPFLQETKNDNDTIMLEQIENKIDIVESVAVVMDDLAKQLPVGKQMSLTVAGIG